MRGLLRPKKDSIRVFEDERRSTLTPALSLREREKGGTVRGITLSLREREKGGTVRWITLTPTLSLRERGKSGTVHWITLRERGKGKSGLDLSPLPWGEG